MTEQMSQMSMVETASGQTDEIDLQKYWLTLKRRWLPAIATFGITVSLALVAALLEDATYMTEGTIQFRSDRTSSLTGFQNEIGQVEVLTFQAEPLSTQAEIVRSQPVIEAVIQTLDLRNDEGEQLSVNDVLANLKVSTIAGTEILRIAYESGDPEEAANVVNAVLESYRDYNIASNRQDAAAARQFIEEQLPSTEADVLRAEGELRQFKERNNVISLEEEAVNSVEVLSTLEQNITQLESQIASANARLGQLQQQLSIDPGSAIALSTLSQSAGVQTVLTELQLVQTELASERARYRSPHPIIAELERRQAELEALLAERIQSVLFAQNAESVDVLVGNLQLGDLRQELILEFTQLQVEQSGLLEQRAQLIQAQAGYQERASTLPGLEENQRELERRLLAYQTTYETLLTQLQEVRLVESQIVGNVRIISRAQIPDAPAGSNSKLYLAAGLIVGVLMAIAVAFLLDLLDSSVKTTKEAEDLFGYTLLGIIPQVADPASQTRTDPLHPRLLINQDVHVGVREAYQMLQANLRFLQSDHEFKVFAVTSASIGEGKSEVSVNLAAALAQVGKKVLIVDADMRYPRQHHAVKVLNNIGLSHLIAGQAEIEAAVQPVMDNLDVLTAGVVPPNPLALLDSKRMASLLNVFSQTYDAVIVDLPSVLGYADASVVSKMADGVILVARPGQFTYDQGRAAKEALERTRQRIFGMVINGVKPTRDLTRYLSRVEQGSIADGLGENEDIAVSTNVSR